MQLITKKQTEQKVELYRTHRKRLLSTMEYLTYSINEAITDPYTKRDVSQLIKELLARQILLSKVIKKLAKFTDLLQCKIKIERR